MTGSYARPLAAHKDALAMIAEKARSGTVTILYGAREKRFNNAVAMKGYIERKLLTREKELAATTRA